MEREGGDWVCGSSRTIQAAVDQAVRVPKTTVDPTWGHAYHCRMADLKVRQLDERVATALKGRAAKRGVSLEEEVRTTLAASVAARRDAFRRRAAALRAATAPTSRTGADSVRTIRRERDASG